MGKSTKFARNLSASNKDIRGQRADMLSEEVALEVEGFVGDLKRERVSLKNKIVRLTDLAPDSKDSLRAGSKDFNAKAWVAELHQAKMDLKLKEIELEVGNSIEKEWFTEEEVKGAK